LCASSQHSMDIIRSVSFVCETLIFTTIAISSDERGVGAYHGQSEFASHPIPFTKGRYSLTSVLLLHLLSLIGFSGAHYLEKLFPATMPALLRQYRIKHGTCSQLLCSWHPDHLLNINHPCICIHLYQFTKEQVASCVISSVTCYLL
jgi:hypothetical protein